jgi:hypothetical protein
LMLFRLRRDPLVYARDADPAVGYGQERPAQARPSLHAERRPLLMPTKKDRAEPDLQYFTQSRK